MKALTEKVQRMGFNSLAILTSDVLTRASTLFVYVLVGRNGGDAEFGQLSLGLMLLYTFHVFAVAGLPTLLVREVARSPSTAKRILYHGYVGTLLPAILSFLAMTGFAMVMQYSWTTTAVILLLAFALLPYAFSVIAESVIRGNQKMPWIVVGNIPGSLFLVAGCYAVISANATVVQLAVVVVVSRFINMLAMHVCCIQISDTKSRARLRWRYAWLLLKKSLVFLWSDAIAAISASLNAVLLSKFAGEREVGWLTACFQLLQPMLMVYRSVGNSCFPVLVQSVQNKRDSLTEICQTLIVLLWRLAIPAAVVLFSLSGDILVLVYRKEEFRAAAPILKILAMTLLLDTLNPVIGHGLWAAGKEKLVLKIVIVNFLVSLTLSAVLVSQYGILGAGWSVLLSSSINVLQHYVYFQVSVGRMSLFHEVLKMFPILLISGLILALPTHLYLKLGLALFVYGIMNLWVLRPLIRNFSVKSILKNEPKQSVSP
jgi:O-antigen/teichoic acid export membrane protein